MAVCDIHNSDKELLESLIKQASSITMSDKDLDIKLDKVISGVGALEAKGISTSGYGIFTVVRNIKNMREAYGRRARAFM